MDAILSLSAPNIIEKIKGKEFTSVEVSSAFINRIAQINPLINAIHQWDAQRILEDARLADQAILSGWPIGKLHGLPITIKDTCHVKGFTISKGCVGLFKSRSTYDSTVVSRLKSAGAIILGITNTPELLLSYETDNLLYGRTNNPYDQTRTSGGSSGGEAAIISAGGSPAGIGSDAGGSIRQPAHYCGICAHKPTQGLLPLTGNFPMDGVGIGASLLSMGPMAKYVEDLILLMGVISGADDIDPNSPPVLFKNPQQVDLGSLKVAYFYDNPTGTPPCDDTINTMNNVVNFLRPIVLNIQEDYPKELNNIYRLHLETFMFGGDGGQTILDLFNSLGQQEISPLTKEFLALASNTYFSTTELRKRLVEVEQFKYNMQKFMVNYDVIISPVTATAARPHGETFVNIRDVGYIVAHNLTGWPATVVPCGYDKNGLPIGLQIAAKKWHDHVSLAVGLAIQNSRFFPIVFNGSSGIPVALRRPTT